MVNVNSVNNVDIWIDFRTMSLWDTLRNPHNIAHFLLFQFDQWIENTKMKLLHKRIDIHLDFMLEKFVLQTLIIPGSNSIKNSFVFLDNYVSMFEWRKSVCLYTVIVGNGLHLFIIVCSRKHSQSFRIQLTTFGIKLSPFFFAQFSTKWINGDNKRSSISFKCKNFAHQFCSCSTKLLTESIKIFNISLISIELIYTSEIKYSI